MTTTTGQSRHLTHLEEDLDAVDEEKYDNDEHKHGVATVENVRVKLSAVVRRLSVGCDAIKIALEDDIADG